MRIVSILKIVYSSIFCLLLPLNAISAVFYVDVNTGNDSNPGSQGAPWKTITYAENNTSAGDTVYVKGGNYISEGTITFNNTAGTSGSPITILASDILDKPITRGMFFSSDWWVVDGFYIHNSTGSGLQFNTGSKNIIVQNMVVNNPSEDYINCANVRSSKDTVPDPNPGIQVITVQNSTFLGLVVQGATM